MGHTTTAKTKLADLTAQLERNVASLKLEVDAHATKFVADPLYALQWGDAMFDTAAELAVMSKLLAACKNPAAVAMGDAYVQELLDECLATIFRMARDTSRSTSPCRNIATDAERRVWSSIVDNWGGLFNG